MEKTTQEYHQLVEENERLIYGFCKKYGLRPEEIYDVLAIALCKAAKNYDPEYGASFSSFAYQAMDNEMKAIHRKDARNNPNEIQTVLFEDLMPSRWDDAGEAPNALEILSDGKDFTVDLDYSVDIKRFFNCLNQKEKSILSMILQGCSTKDIGNAIGRTRQSVTNDLRKIRYKYMASMNYEDKQTCERKRRYR